MWERRRGLHHLWGACLQQGNDPKNGYACTWAFQTASIAAGIACGAMVISAKDHAESPLRVYGPGANLADHRLLGVTAGGELTLACGTGNGYRFAELMGATNPSGWSCVLKVKTPAGATAGYIPQTRGLFARSGASRTASRSTPTKRRRSKSNAR